MTQPIVRIGSVTKPHFEGNSSNPKTCTWVRSDGTACGRTVRNEDCYEIKESGYGYDSPHDQQETHIVVCSRCEEDYKAFLASYRPKRGVGFAEFAASRLRNHVTLDNRAEHAPMRLSYGLSTKKEELEELKSKKLVLSQPYRKEKTEIIHSFRKLLHS